MGDPLVISDDAWRARLTDLGWNTFNALWNLSAETVEAPNVRRGGWSSVVRIQTPDGAMLYLKRQENHDFRDGDARFRKRPTVLREARAAAVFDSLGVGIAQLVCVGVEQKSSLSRGLLLTEALDLHRDLPAVLSDPTLNSERRSSVWCALAETVRRLHQHRYRHNCLYGQHVLLKEDETRRHGWDLRLIDLEKVSRVLSRKSATIGDLSQLDRHTDDMSNRDRQIFWDAYFNGVTLLRRRRILKRIAGRTADRMVKQYLADRDKLAFVISGSG